MPKLKVTSKMTQVALFLTALEGGAILFYLGKIPTDPKNAWLFGYSLVRLAMMAFVLGISSLSLFLFIMSIKDRIMRDAIASRLDRGFETKFYLITLCSIIIAIGGFGSFGQINNLPPDFLYRAYLIRLSPLILFLSLISVNLLALAIPFFPGKKIYKSTPKITAQLLGTVAVVLLVLTSLVILNRAEILTFWRTAEIEEISQETGNAYIAFTHHPELSSHHRPSSAQVFEDGKPLPYPGNAVHDDIRALGNGRYSFWYEHIIFSSSDNTSPVENDRRYEIVYPFILVDGLARTAYLFTTVAWVLLVWFVIAFNGKPDVKRMMIKWKAIIDSPIFIFLTVFLGSLAMIIVGYARVNPAFESQKDILWGVAIALNLLAAWAMGRKFNAQKLWWYFVPFFLALVISIYLFIVVADNKFQGCKSDQEYSVWEAYCTSPDSASYYFGWNPGSPRQPLYPWFIQLATLGTDFEPGAYLQAYPVAEAISDSEAPLFRVERAQIVLLMGASLVACILMMRVLNSHLPTLLFLYLLDHNFYTVYELNNILTEALVQAWLFLLVGVFLLFMWKSNKKLLLVAALVCGMIYLTRQASAYSALFLGGMILWRLLLNWREYWKPSVAALFFVLAIAAIPDLLSLASSGKSAQEALTYQYRIVFALRIAQPDDVELMPDDVSKKWLADSLEYRDIKDNEFDEMCGDNPYCQNIYRVESAYEVAITQRTEVYEPEFYLAVSNAIFKQRWLDYLKWGFDVWHTAMEYPGVDRIGVHTISGNTVLSSWWVYGIAFALATLVRGRIGFSSAILILAHWSHVMICSLFSIPGPRWVWASDGLVIIALFLIIIKVGQLSLQAIFTDRKITVLSLGD